MTDEMQPMAIIQEILKVSIKMSNGDEFFGRMFVTEGTRIQDVLNDHRRFLPIEKHMHKRGPGNQDTWVMHLINKDLIMEVEER